MALTPIRLRSFGEDITATTMNTPPVSPTQPARSRSFGEDITTDTTNTPPPQERTRPQQTPEAVRNLDLVVSSLGGGSSPTGGSSSPTATAKVQRFSLRSRSARLRGSKVFRHVSCRRLKLPEHLKSDTAECVKVCECTADPCLGAGRRRLCKRATDDHDEFRLLELLNSRFIADSRSGGERIATKACMNKMDISFILDPSSDAAMGYAAITPDFDHGITPGSAGFCLSDDLAGFITTNFCRSPLLSQLYVEPQARGKGLATAALRVLLASQPAVVVETPSLATAKAMLRLGFKPVGVRAGRVAVLYVRAEALMSGRGADENA